LLLLLLKVAFECLKSRPIEDADGVTIKLMHRFIALWAFETQENTYNLKFDVINFALHLLLVANGALFMQKWEHIMVQGLGLISGLGLVVDIHRSG